MAKKRSTSIACSVLLFLLAGCVTISSPYVPVSVDPVSDLAFGYVEGSERGTLAQYKISANGLWTGLTPPDVSTGRFPVSLAVDPAGQHLYSANRDDNTISQYKIDPVTGSARPDEPSTVPAGNSPVWLTVDPSGRFLYAAAHNDQSITMFTIDQTSGGLTPMMPASIPFSGASGTSYPTGLVVDPLGQYLFATDGSIVDSFVIDQTTGMLSPAKSPFAYVGSALFPPAVDPTGSFLYFPDSSPGVLRVLAIDRVTGAVLPAATPSVTVGAGASSVALDPRGRFLYCVNRGDQTISQFTVQPGGNLTPMAVPLVHDPGLPWQMLVDPSGQLAYVSNEGTGLLTIYRIGADGGLVPYSEAQAGFGASGIAVARRR